MPLAASLLCLVVAISDGDTLTARCGAPGAYQQVKVRIAAIDAPESRQAFGQKSRQHLAQLCFANGPRCNRWTRTAMAAWWRRCAAAGRT